MALMRELWRFGALGSLCLAGFGHAVLSRLVSSPLVEMLATRISKLQEVAGSGTRHTYWFLFARTEQQVSECVKQ